MKKPSGPEGEARAHVAMGDAEADTGATVVDDAASGRRASGAAPGSPPPAAAESRPRNRRPTDLSGVRLGDFFLEKEIGRGAFGVVYRARQMTLDRQVAVKAISARVDMDTIRRFQIEAQLLARFSHPYASHVYAYGAEPSGIIWFAMEYVRGPTLSQLLASRGPLPLPLLSLLLDKLAEVIDEAHSVGIVHRDIKASNVMLVRSAGSSWPKLLDFGIARMVRVFRPEGELPPEDDIPRDVDIERGVETLRNDAVVERGSRRIGTPQYMAPEIWRGSDHATAASDIYALGVLAFYLLMGTYPFVAPVSSELERAHRDGELPAMPGVLPKVRAIIDRAMAKAPADRWPSASEMAEALRDCLAKKTIAAPLLPAAVRDAWSRAPQPIADAIRLAEDEEYSPASFRALRSALSSYLLTLYACAGVRETSSTVANISTWLQRVHAERKNLGLADVPAFQNHLADEGGLAPIVEMSELLAAWPEARLRAVDSATFAGRDEQLELGHLLADLLPLTSYGIVEATERGWRWWGGGLALRRRSAEVVGRAAPGTLALIDRAGQILSELPLAQAIHPAPHQPRCLFMFSGNLQELTRLDSFPLGFRYLAPELEDWWREHYGLRSATEIAEREASPFKGLASYEPDDASLFFGRAEETTTALNRLRIEPFLTVVGPSGAGKSSFVNAGMLPALRGWAAIRLRPGPRPLDALRAAFLRYGLTQSVAELALLSDRELAELARSLALPERTIIVVDQLEELVALSPDPALQNSFAVFVMALARSVFDPIRVLLTLRDDFLGALEAVPALRHRISNSMLFLGTPRPEELEQVLVEPLRRFGYAYEDDRLVTEMVAALATETGGLPLLSFAADQLWERRDPASQTIKRDAYYQMGGVGGALARYADRLLEEMTPAERPLVREMFRHVVTGVGTRVPVAKTDMLELITATGSGPVAAQRVISTVVDSRLMVASKGSEGEMLEIAHEALLRSWPRLVEWRREDEETLRLRDQLRTAAKQWHDRGRPDGLLWRDEALVELKLWRARYAGQLVDRESAFIDASLALDMRGRLFRRRLLIGAVVVLAAGLLVLGALFVEARHQRRQALAAEKQVGEMAARTREGFRAAMLAQARDHLSGGALHRGLAYLAEATALGASGQKTEFLASRALDKLEREKKLIWRPGNAHNVWVHPGAARSAWSVARDGKQVFEVVDDESGRPTASVSGPSQYASALWLSEDRVLAGTFSGVLVELDATSGEVRPWNEFGSAVAGLYLDGDHVAVTTATSGIWLYEASSRRHLATVGAGLCDARWHQGRIWFVCEDGRLRSATPEGELSGGTKTQISGYNQLEIGASDMAAVYSNQGSRARLFSLADGRALGTLSGHTATLSHVLFSGESVVTVDFLGVINVWDRASLELSHTLRGHEGRINSVAAEGDWLLTGGSDSTARLWSVREGIELEVFDGHVGEVVASQFLEGGLMATASRRGKLFLWDESAIPSLRARALAPPTSTLVRDGGRALVVPNVGDAFVLGPGDARVVLAAAAGAPDVDGHLPLGDRRIGALHGDTAVVPNGRGALVYRFDGDRWAERIRCRGGKGKTVTALWVPSRREALLGDERGTLLRCGEDGTESVVRAALGPRAALLGLALSPDEKTVAIAEGSGGVTLLRLADGAILRSLPIHDYGATALAWSEGGDALASGGIDQRLEMTAAENGVSLWSRELQSDIVRVLVRNPFVYAVTRQGALHVFDATDGSPIYEAAPQGETQWAELDGASVLVVLSDGRTVAQPISLAAEAIARAARAAACRGAYTLENQELVPRAAPSDCGAADLR